jgi:hypothetical protein
MTNLEAKALTKGDYVASPHSTPAYKIRRLSADPWISTDGTIVRIRLGGSVEWIPADSFVRAPGSNAAVVYDVASRTFVSRFSGAAR